MGQAASTPSPPPPSQHTSSASAGGCPVKHEASSSGALNPLNKMPDLPQTQAAGQQSVLSTSRTTSSIPKPANTGSSSSACPVAHTSSSSGCPVSKDASGSLSEVKEDKWEYPSPQQFYNALVRKGWETPEESVDMMVQIHNWLNERAWLEVRKWEVRHPHGELSQLAKFEGRPGDLSPKARWHLFMGSLFPSRYNTIRPFDRHDWVVLRPSMNGAEPPKLQRYVIDYYALPDDREGNPVFSLDVRPALDNWESVALRLQEFKKQKYESWFGAERENA
ncbi:cytochrome c and c1 heme-lyase [Atractiella rhizophila]|nr:cytochrome c and c1 heme-lyase [Atractiella rhizophila]